MEQNYFGKCKYDASQAVKSIAQNLSPSVILTLPLFTRLERVVPDLQHVITGLEKTKAGMIETMLSLSRRI